MLSQAMIKDLQSLLGEQNVLTSDADRQSYSYDAAVLPEVIPAVVVIPHTTEELGKTVKMFYEAGIPMTVRGGGTNLSGGHHSRQH